MGPDPQRPGVRVSSFTCKLSRPLAVSRGPAAVMTSVVSRRLPITVEHGSCMSTSGGQIEGSCGDGWTVET